MMSEQFFPLKLRWVSAICGFHLIGGIVLAGEANGADTRSVNERQNAKLNISVIQLKKAREAEIELEQKGIKNISISTQVDVVPEDGHTDNSASHKLKQKGVTNIGVSYQDAYSNKSSILQQASENSPPTKWSENSLTVMDVGDEDLLLRFRSGEVDILTFTSEGYAATSHFGRDH